MLISHYIYYKKSIQHYLPLTFATSFVLVMHYYFSQLQMRTWMPHCIPYITNHNVTWHYLSRYPYTLMKTSYIQIMSQILHSFTNIQQKYYTYNHIKEHYIVIIITLHHSGTFTYFLTVYHIISIPLSALNTSCSIQLHSDIGFLFNILVLHFTLYKLHTTKDIEYNILKWMNQCIKYMEKLECHDRYMDLNMAYTLPFESFCNSELYAKSCSRYNSGNCSYPKQNGGWPLNPLSFNNEVALLLKGANPLIFVRGSTLFDKKEIN